MIISWPFLSVLHTLAAMTDKPQTRVVRLSSSKEMTTNKMMEELGVAEVLDIGAPSSSSTSYLPMDKAVRSIAVSKDGSRYVCIYIHR